MKRNPVAKALRNLKKELLKIKKNIIEKKLKNFLNKIYLLRKDFLYSEGI
jgi:hypothetical protein